MGEPRNIGLIGYDGVQALDLVGPSDAFASARLEGEDQTGGRGALMRSSSLA